jgi:hypothetical protein
MNVLETSLTSIGWLTHPFHGQPEPRRAGDISVVLGDIIVQRPEAILGMARPTVTD